MPLGLASPVGPLGDRIDEALPSGDALDERPPVVRAGFDTVQLVPRVLSELARPHRAVGSPRDALHVAMPHRPDAGAPRVAGRRSAVRCDAQDLAAEGVGVLRGIALLRVACRDVQVAVRAEREAPAVMRAGPWDAVQHHLGLAQLERSRLAVERHPHHAIVVRGAEVREEHRRRRPSSAARVRAAPIRLPTRRPAQCPPRAALRRRSARARRRHRAARRARRRRRGAPPTTGAARPDASVPVTFPTRHRPSLVGETLGPIGGRLRRGRRSRGRWRCSRRPRSATTRRHPIAARASVPRHPSATAASSAARSMRRMRSIACTARCAIVGVGVTDQLDQAVGDDLPRQAPAVLEPPAGLLLTPVRGQCVPVAVDLGLSPAGHVERERLCERELRSGIHPVVVPAPQAEVHVHDFSAHSGDLVRVPVDAHHLGVRDERRVERDRLFGGCRRTTGTG